MALGVFQVSVLAGTGAVEVQPNAGVEIRRSSDNVLVQLYDAYQDGNAIGNPTQADAEGFVRVWLEPDSYNITMTNGGETRTLERHVIVDPAAATTPTGVFNHMPEVNGVPIIESGSNSNGSFIKFSSGDLICSQIDETAAPNPAGWTFPHEFIGLPRVLPVPRLENAARIANPQRGSSTMVGINRFLPSGSAAGTNFQVIAIGRWK